MALVAHLRLHLVPACGLGDRAGLGDGVRQRLLTVHVLAGLQCRQRDRGVRVIRRRDHHGVDALLLLEHLAVIRVHGRFRIQRDGLRRVVAVDVAQGDDVLARAGLQVGAAHSPDADPCDVQLVAGRLRSQHPAGNDGRGECRQGRGRRKLPARDRSVRVFAHVVCSRRY